MLSKCAIASSRIARGFTSSSSSYPSSATPSAPTSFSSPSSLKSLSSYSRTTPLLTQNLPSTFSQCSRSYSTAATKSFLLADIGEGISEVEVLQWYVEEGDVVEQFTPLCEVQSDKATVPITSRFGGVLKKLHYEVGEMAKVGAPLCDILTEDASEDDTPAPSDAAPEASSTPAPTPTPSASVSAPEVDVSQTITTSRGSRKVAAAPAVRSLAKANNIDLSVVPGTGKDGRVTKGDLLSFLESPTSSAPAATAASTTAAPIAAAPIAAAPTVTAAVPRTLAQDEVVPLRGFRRAMVSSMTQSLSVPHLGLSDEIDMTRLVKMRTMLKPVAASRGVKLSYMPFVLKAISLAIKSYPIVNARMNDSATEVTLVASHNIAIAIDTPGGLVVPNIKNVQDLSVLEIASELSRLISLAHDNKLSPDDLSNSTFSLSNIGAIAGTYASPVLVPNTVTIGAIGKIQKLPRYNELDEVVPVHIMNVSWSADHRVIDGGNIANFSNLVKQYLEEPGSMTFDLR
eukprot:TRINITY_DN1776_c0_g1_i1.p1 TRINITY_DN1776_c0_g1~~TRINITY_DN1776_c0_g1_i1.p1  ORF type:complete len:514 (+),score=150.46 TRINITY_DN1776_c0_g1_i1:31-1572(+)